jgi:hypothetical protein
MGATRRQKQTLVASNPLRDTSILQHVFKYLPGCWLFLGAVCREWNAVYADMRDHQMPSSSLYCSHKLLAYGSKSTLFSATLASPATARLARACGLAFHNNAKLQQMAGLLADMEMLLASRELGMRIGDDVVRAVARSGRLSIEGLEESCLSGSEQRACVRLITARVLELQKGVTWQYYSIFAVQAVAGIGCT